MAFQITGDLDRPGNTRKTCDMTIIIMCTISAVDDKMITYSLSAYMWFICLFDLLLYVHGKQLRLCWDDQLFNHTDPGQASLETVYQYLEPIRSPETDTCSSLISGRGKQFPGKNVLDARFDLGTACIRRG